MCVRYPSRVKLDIQIVSTGRVKTLCYNDDPHSTSWSICTHKFRKEWWNAMFKSCVNRQRGNQGDAQTTTTASIYARLCPETSSSHVCSQRLDWRNWATCDTAHPDKTRSDEATSYQSDMTVRFTACASASCEILIAVPKPAKLQSSQCWWASAPTVNSTTHSIDMCPGSWRCCLPICDRSSVRSGWDRDPSLDAVGADCTCSLLEHLAAIRGGRWRGRRRRRRRGRWRRLPV